MKLSKPEDEELAKKKQELADLESELADRELYLLNLCAHLAAFERLYLKIVGSRYAQLDEIKAEIAERLAGQRAGDQKAQEFAKRARSQANESRYAADARGADNSSTMGPSQELKSLYREVAKRVHPDLSLDAEDRIVRERLMSSANRAYEKRDLERLRQILEEYETSPETVKGEGVGADLVRTIRKIRQVRKRLGEIEKESQRISASALAKLKVKSEEYKKRDRDLLAEMAEQVDREIASAQRELAHLVG